MITIGSDVPMETLMHSWYWGARQRRALYDHRFLRHRCSGLGYKTQIVYMLARDGTVIADDDAKVCFDTDRVAMDGKTGKPVPDVTRYTYRDAGPRYVVSFKRERNILQAILTDGPLPEADHRPAARKRYRHIRRQIRQYTLLADRCAQVKDLGFVVGRAPEP
jgi:hypothetical protein